MAIVIYSFSDLYHKTHIQSVYSVTGRKFNHGQIIIINLFQQRIYSSFLQITYTFNLSEKSANMDLGIYTHTHTYIYIYIEREREVDTMTTVWTAALLPTKPSSDDDSGFTHGFGAWSIITTIPERPMDITRLCWIVITLWDCHIHADAVRALFWIFFYIFPLVRWRKSNAFNAKPQHPTSIGNNQPFLTHCSRRSYFYNLCWLAQSKFSSKGSVNSITKTSFNLTDQMTIFGRLVVNAISVGNI